MTPEFLLTAFVVVLLPGTGVIYTVAIGLGRGFSASVAAAVGCTLGIVPAAIASIVGLAALLHTSALAFQIMKYAGVAYLFYMAWQIVREDGALAVREDSTPSGSVRIALNGILLNVLNPKLSLFFLAFLPQFVNTNSALGSNAQLVLLAALFMLMTLLVFIGYGACATLARDHVISRPTVLGWIRRGFAGTFGLLGLRLAFSDR